MCRREERGFSTAERILVRSYLFIQLFARKLFRQGKLQTVAAGDIRELKRKDISTGHVQIPAENRK
jgi:hypothetical protein